MSGILMYCEISSATCHPTAGHDNYGVRSKCSLDAARALEDPSHLCTHALVRGWTKHQNDQSLGKSVVIHFVLLVQYYKVRSVDALPICRGTCTNIQSIQNRHSIPQKQPCAMYSVLWVCNWKIDNIQPRPWGNRDTSRLHPSSDAGQNMLLCSTAHVSVRAKVSR